VSATKLELPTDTDAQRCLVCGQDTLDTGWECTNCGADCMAFYYRPDTKGEPR
jgi:hypothetical protein